MRHETPLRHVLTTALAAAVLCIPAAQAANHAPPGVNFAEHWMEGGGRATLRASSERTLDDGARYRADVWDVVDADGSPGQDPHNPDNFLSGVYEAIDSGNGWVCINLTLEGQCLPTVPGNALYIGQDAQGSYAVMCLTRATPEGECLVESDEIRLDDTTEHTAPRGSDLHRDDRGAEFLGRRRPLVGDLAGGYRRHGQRRRAVCPGP